MGAAELGAQEGWGPSCLMCWHSLSLFLGQGVPSFRLCWSFVSGHGSYPGEPVWRVTLTGDIGCLIHEKSSSSRYCGDDGRAVLCPPVGT